MKKSLKILYFILIIGFAFVLGWRVMPKVWPSIKEAVVYPVFPQMKPTPAPTQEPYAPKSTAAFEDAIQREGLNSINIRVALMGCIVNGPGEAREADVGIAGGVGEDLFCVC